MANTTQQADMELVARYLAGDIAALGNLFKQYRRRLVNMLTHMLKDHDEAEDVVQEAFIKALRGLHQFRGDATLYTWLASISINTAKGVLQKRKRKLNTAWSAHAVALPDVDEDERTDLVTPEDVCACGELVAIVGAAFANMRPEHEIAITLHEVDGLSYQEIAVAMGSPIGTVRSRIASARTVIAARLAKVANC